MSKSIFGISTLNEVVAGMRVTSTAYKAALEEGRIIGRREMKPLLGELIEALEDFQLEHSYSRKKEALVARAKEAIEND